ncbi:MAG: NAD(P)H-dependent glycerol-3-phosphate dehydrogenase [Pseudomonadota bacterium]
MRTLGVIGAGAWGSALAIRWAANGQPVRLWGRDASVLAGIETERENSRYLPGVALPRDLQTAASMNDAAGADICLIAVPSASFAEVLSRLGPALSATTPVLWATKGFEPTSTRMLHDVVVETVGRRPIGVIAGPTFAREVAQGLPAAVAIAASDARFSQWLVDGFHADRFRVYSTDDLTGVAVAGAVKNVLAIAAGIADGLALGANTRAALISRGLAEMTRLGLALGAKSETFFGLAGLGDLVLTCTDDQSRNRRFGLALGRGQSATEALASIGVVEGHSTAAALLRHASTCGVEMPISEQVHRVLTGDIGVAAAVQALLAREVHGE